MEVILLEKISNLGSLGDKVRVKAGYGRNFLIPFGKAVRANETNIAEFEQRRAGLEKAAAEKASVAEARAEKLAGLTVTIGANAGDEGRLFGSVGPRDVADAITAAGVEVTKSEVKMPAGPIREIGDFGIDVLLHSEVTVTVTVSVTAA